MKKLSNITESVWADIHRRSNGVQGRKEDDVNLLDLIDFYNYIKEQYKSKVEYIDLDAMGGGNGDVLGVDITENIILFYKPKRGHILLSWSKVKIPMPFFDELTDMFKVENPNAMRRIITEKDGSCTNKTFIDVIEFFLGHKDGLVNESVWADIHKRSNGEKVRKEDDVNQLSIDELCDYLKKRYETQILSIRSITLDKDPYISVPFVMSSGITYGNTYGFCTNLHFDEDEDEQYITIPKEIKKEFPKCYKLIDDNYTILPCTKSYAFAEYYYRVYLKNNVLSKIDNQFFIDFIDFLIDNKYDGNKIIKRK